VTRRSIRLLASARCFDLLRYLLTGSISAYGLCFCEDAMTFTIHASENGQSVMTVRTMVGHDELEFLYNEAMDIG